MERRHHERIRNRALEEANVGKPPEREWGKPVAITLGVVALGLFLWFFVSRVMPDGESGIAPDERTENVAGNRGEALSSLQVEEFANKILKAESIEELLKLVEHPEMSRPRMQEHYADERNSLPIGGTIRRITETELDGTVVYAVIIDRINGMDTMLPVTEGDGGEPTVEWEAAVGWFDPGWDELLDTKPVEPTYVKVFVVKDDYYNYDFRDELKWQCVKLTDWHATQFCYAYIDRSNPVSLDLENFRAFAPAVLKIKFSPGQKRNQAEIVEFNNISWFRKE